MAMPVCRVGDMFSGWCSWCGEWVYGTMRSGSDFVTIEGIPICVTGSEGRGFCGHYCYSVGGSTVFQIENIPVARVGDRVTGGIEGNLISGSDFVFAD